MADKIHRMGKRTMRKNEPKFVFKKHRTPESALRAFTKESGWDLKDIDFGTKKNPYPALEVAQGLRVQGMWGFAETWAKPFKIHFWHDGKRSEEELMRFFAHELGHCTGRKMKGIAEEHRADEFGEVAVMATRLARKNAGKRA